MFSPPSPASKNATPSISLRALLVGGENTLSSSPGMVGRSQTFDRRTGVDVPVLDTSCAFIIRDRFLGGRWWSVASGVSWTVVGEDFFSRARVDGLQFQPGRRFLLPLPPCSEPAFPAPFRPRFPFLRTFLFLLFFVCAVFSFLVYAASPFYFLSEGGVPPVLDVVVAPSWQHSRDFRPTVSKLRALFYNKCFLLLRPLLLRQVWVQVVVPSLTALLSNPTGQKFSNVGPLCLPILLHKHLQLVILLRGPRALPFHDARVQDVPPVLKALDLGLFRPKAVGNFLPVLSLVQCNGCPQHLVFFGCPPHRLLRGRVGVLQQARRARGLVQRVVLGTLCVITSYTRHCALTACGYL